MVRRTGLGEMQVSIKFWSKQLSLLVFIGMIAYLPARISGELFSIVARHYGPPESDVAFSMVGTLFGFCVISLLLIGVIAIPGELSGLIRSYRQADSNVAEARSISRKVLLVAVSVLAWGAFLTLVVSVFYFRRG